VLLSIIDSIVLILLGTIYTVIGSFITGISGGILAQDEDSNIYKYFFGMIAFVLFTTSIMYIGGVIEIMYGLTSTGDIYLTGELPYAHIYSITLISSPVYLTLYSSINYEGEIGETVKDIKKSYSNLKSYIGRKYRSIRGIEYVKMES
jgi:hypothetical protein